MDFRRKKKVSNFSLYVYTYKKKKSSHKARGDGEINKIKRNDEKKLKLEFFFITLK